MQRRHFTISLLSVLTVLLSLPSLAQKPSAPPKTPMLELIRYAPKEQGPLLWIGKPNMLTITLPTENTEKARADIGKTTVQQLATKTRQQLIHEGNLSALVPTMMEVIPEKLPAPDPLADMPRSQRIQILLSLLTREQWKTVGSKNGIGSSDLNNEQRAIFDSLFPENTLSIWHNRVEHDGQDRTSVFAQRSHGSRESVSVSGVRLRFTQHPYFLFSGTDGKSDVSYSKDIGDANNLRTKDAQGETIQTLSLSDHDDGYESDGQHLFGAHVVQYLPNHLKPGQLDLDAPALSAPVLLDGSVTTVGGLIRLAAKATRFDIRSDSAYDQLTVSYRVTPGGQSVYAGDLLKVICRSVTGTFRRLDSPQGALYLLTNSVEGTGTSYARLDRWAKKPKQMREQILKQAMENCRKQDPLELIGTAPNDPLALTPEQMQKINAEYRKGGYAIPMTPADISPALQKEMDKAIDYYRSLPEPDSVSLNRNKFKIATTLQAEIVLPDGRALPMVLDNLTGFAWDFLRGIATSPSAPPTLPTLAELKLLPITISATVKRRVLVSSLPGRDAEIAPLFATARQKGFTEIWFQVPPTDAASKRLTDMITVGKAQKMPIGAVVSWLNRRAADEQGRADRNIFGETSDEWLAKYTPPEATPSGIEKASVRELQHDYRELYAGNLVPGSEVTARRCVALAKIDGLSALVLEDAILPGWGGSSGGSDGLDEETRFGYSIDTRIACIRAKGFDPVDIAEYARNAKMSPSEDFVEYPATRRGELAEFRRQQSTAYLQTLFTRLHGAAPQLPLYIADAGSTDTSIHRTHFMRWTAANKTPSVFSGSNEESTRQSVQPLSSEALRASGTAFRKYQETLYWYLVTEEVKSAPQWQGYVLNAGHDSPEEIQALLTHFADAPKAAPTKP